MVLLEAWSQPPPSDVFIPTFIKQDSFIGIDNGVTGAISVIQELGHPVLGVHTPVITEQTYTKKKQSVTRLNFREFSNLLGFIKKNSRHAYIYMERPMVDFRRFHGTLSAIRCLEAQLIAIEDAEIPYEYVDSRQWQKLFIPKGVEGPELKTVGIQMAKRKWPEWMKRFDDKGLDAISDSLFIAEFGRQKHPNISQKEPSE